MDKKPIQFPKRFLWGAATSAHQVEGGLHNQWSVWELENARALASKAEYQYHDLPIWDDIQAQAKAPDNYVSGIGADHYNLYEVDFLILQKLNLNSFRYSIEWSRIEPEEGVWNAEAIEHYKTYTKRLRELNIEPLVTLFHFTLPVWFTEKGGFEKRRNVKYFVRFAQKIIAELGSDVRIITTINEPVVYVLESYFRPDWPPAFNHDYYKVWRVLNNLATAHNRVAKALHKMNRRYKLTISQNSTYFYPGDTAWLSNLSTHVLQFLDDDYFLRKVIKQCDVLGVNYYFSSRLLGYRIHNPTDVKKSDVGWDLNPSHLQYVLERLYRKYKLPLLVTESGLADSDDSRRRWLISQHILAMQKAMHEGVEVIGYLHWCLLDNFEWAWGRWPRYGLVEINYETKKRTIRPSAHWYGRIVKKITEESK